MASITAMPGDKRARVQPERVRFQPGVAGQEETAVEAAPRPGREMRINKTDLEQHGYDADCPQCRHMQLHGKAKSGVFHTKRCRDTIVKAIAETPEGRARRGARGTHDPSASRASGVEHPQPGTGGP